MVRGLHPKPKKKLPTKWEIVKKVLWGYHNSEIGEFARKDFILRCWYEYYKNVYEKRCFPNINVAKFYVNVRHAIFEHDTFTDYLRLMVRSGWVARTSPGTYYVSACFESHYKIATKPYCFHYIALEEYSDRQRRKVNRQNLPGYIRKALV